MRQSIVIMARHRIAVLSTVEKTAISRSFRFSILLLKKVSVCFSRKNVMVPPLLACRKNWGSRTVSWELSDFFLYIFAYEKIRVWPPLKKHKRDFSAQHATFLSHSKTLTHIRITFRIVIVNSNFYIYQYFIDDMRRRVKKHIEKELTLSKFILYPKIFIFIYIYKFESLRLTVFRILLYCFL